MNIELLLKTVWDLECELRERLVRAVSVADAEAVRVNYLGKSGSILMLMKGLGGVADQSERQKCGAVLNSARDSFTRLIQDRLSSITAVELESRLRSEGLDVSRSCRSFACGAFHPVSRVISDFVKIASRSGFSHVHGPELETEYHVFDALNTPENHPARSESDTMYLKEECDGRRVVLRTHTSSVQIRHMERSYPPIRIITAGRVYRNDCDATHTPVFHQIEGLCIDIDVSMPNMKQFLITIIREVVGCNLEYRFRSSFFPFARPGAEMDIKFCNKWVEVLGCGMVHPTVLHNMSVDCNKYSGFAFGIGVERIAMIKYGLNDIRKFYGGDLAWTKHNGSIMWEGLY